MSDESPRISERFPSPNTGLEEDCGCIYAPGLGGHISTHCREGHRPGDLSKDPT